MDEIRKIDSVVLEASVTPQIDTVDYPEKIDTYNNEQPAILQSIRDVSNEMNDMATDMDAVAIEVDADKNTTINAKSAALQSATEASDDAAIAESAKDTILNFVVPTEAVDNQDTRDAKDLNLIKGTYPAYGFTDMLTVEERFEESGDANTFRDAVGGEIVYSDGIYSLPADTDIIMPYTLFDPLANDELLDDKVNGLTCQVEHDKGDIVVTGNNHTLNGDFETDPNTEWTANNGTIASVAGGVTGNCLEVTRSGAGGDQGAIQSYTLDANTTYILSGYVKSGTTGDESFKFIMYNSISTNIESVEGVSSSSWKPYSVEFTTDNDTTNLIQIRKNTSTDGTMLFDNISVKLKDPIKQATVDTPSSDLTSSDWQTLPQVTTQSVVELTKHKTSKAVAYRTSRLTTYFGEGYSQKDVMEYLGYSQIDKNLWEDSEYEYIFVGLKNSLNTGAYHPDYNAFGTGSFVVGGDTAPYVNLSYPVDWNDTDGGNYGAPFNVYSIFECFGATYGVSQSLAQGELGVYYNGDVNTPSGKKGRPDSKFYDKVYLSGLGGLIPSSKYLAYAGKEPVRLLDSESNELISESWLQGDEEYLTYNTATISEDLTDTSKTLWNLTRKAIEVYQVLYTLDSGITWDIQTFTHDSINNQITLGTARTDIKVNYKASNQSATQSDPQKVLQVQPKAIASNSHSVYKGAMMTYAGTGGKVAVGNGSNGLESRALENFEPNEDARLNIIRPNEPTALVSNTTYLILGFTSLSDGYYKWNGTAYPCSAKFTPPQGWGAASMSASNEVNYLSTLSTACSGSYTTPQHPTISLDNSNSTATKWFTTLAEMEDGELVVQTFSEEGAYNASGYGWDTGTGLTFEQLTNGLKDGVYENDLQTKALVKRLGVYSE